MNYLNTEKDSVLIGSGYLYAIEAADFDATDIDTDDMVEIGYIKENAVFKRTHEAVEINSANYGLVDIVGNKYTTEFETGIISYKAENVARFLTGSKVVTGSNRKTTYFAENDKIPAVALVFVGTDEDTGDEIMLVMPKCKWQGDYELDFNNDNPVELNYNFRCLNVTMPNGKVGAGWLVENYDGSADLSALTLGVLRLSPSFDSGVTEYEAATTNTTNTIVAVAEDSEAVITIKNGNDTIANGNAIEWSAGKNTVTVTVTNGTRTKTYTIVVTKS